MKKVNSLLKTAGELNNYYHSVVALVMKILADGSIGCVIIGGNGNDKGIPDFSSKNLSDVFKKLADVKAGDKIQKFDIQDKVFPGKCIDVYDGDTIHVAMIYNDVLSDFSLRMYGYNSAEIKTKNVEEKANGLRAKEHMKELILGKNVIVHMLGHDMYGGRWLANVYLIEDDGGMGKCINKIMLEDGFGAVYYGKGEKKYQ